MTTAIEDHSIPFANTDPLTDPAIAANLGVRIPEQLVREDGESIYTVHGSQQYTSAAVLDAERRILEAASRTGARVVDEVEVGVALAESAANGTELNAAQAAMVRELATSGRRLQLALAPAGTGKTTAMSVLSRAWRGSGGTVIWLAPSAVAAEELGSAIRGDDVVSDTLAKLVWHIEHGDLPTWMRSIGGDTLVLIDEAGMAATTELATLTDWLAGRGATIRLIGDDRQLASVAAGGVLRDVADQVGAVTLTEVRRFVAHDGSLNAAEAGATLAVRDGDPAALGYYADMGRIHIGDLGSAADQAYAAWSTDRAAGLDSLLLAPTRELVAELNTRARNDRIASLPEPEIGRAIALADGTRASAGDTIVTRRNERLLALSPTDWVKNGDRWQVADVHPDGSMTAVHDELGARVRLPADYAAEHVQLGYATTVHGAQGATVDTCHLVRPPPGGLPSAPTGRIGAGHPSTSVRRGGVNVALQGVRRNETRTEGVTMALTDPASTHRLISISKAADLLGFDPKSIRRFIAAGELPAYRVGRKHIRVEEADVLALIHRIPTTDA